MRLGVIIAAGGGSRRYRVESGLSRSKLDEDLGGRPVLQRAVEIFVNRPEVAAIVVGGPADEIAFAEFKVRHGDRLGLMGVRLCVGGQTRAGTVRNALALVPDDCTHIAVHDAARPCTPPELLDRLLEAALRWTAVIPALAIADTLKRVHEVADDEGRAEDRAAAILGLTPRQRTRRLVGQTVDRAGLVAVQTPQVFRADVLRRAYESPHPDATDDAQQVERLGLEVVVVEGDARNLKITHPGDVALARQVLGLRPPPERPVHKRF